MVEELSKTQGAAANPEAEATSGTDEKNTNDRKTVEAVTFSPNILDDYDSYTYHFRLFMMDEESIANKSVANGEHQIIIAESGATTIDIDDVTITSFPSPGKRNGFGVSTEFQFTLRQPLGATLLDLIFAGANRLGIKNFSKVPVFLELSFRAQEPDRGLGGIAPGFVQDALLGEDSLSTVTWVWPLFLSDMAMDVNSGGSSYVIRAGLYDQTAYTNQASDIEKKTTVSASTVKEFFTGLEKELARKENDKVEKTKTQSFPDTYTFFIDQELSKSKIVPEESEDVATRSADYNVEAPENHEWSFDPGTSIEKIIETILASTKYLQTKAEGKSNPDATTEENQKEKAVVQTLYKVIPDTQIGEFDKTRNDYSRHYKYLIIPYEMTTNMSQTNEKANVSDQQRYDIIANKSRLRKAYNYIYTGLNDQVFDFEIAFNFNWHAAVPFQAGVSTSSATSETTAGTAATDAEGNAIEEAAQKKSLAEQFGIDPDSGVGEFVNDLEDFVTDEATADALITGISTGDFDQLTGQASELLAENVAKGVRVASSNVFPNFIQDGQKEQSPIVEDETPESLNALRSSSSYIESDSGININTSGGYAQSPGKTLLTTMFEQAQSAIDADLLDITMRIKGDPHWLEPLPVGRNSDFKSLFDITLEKYSAAKEDVSVGGLLEDVRGVLEVFTGPKNEVTTMDSAGGQEYMLFRSFTPKEFDADTGLTKGFDSNNVLNGVYGVRMIESNFAAGQFTQTIDAVRDSMISLEGVDLGVGVADTRSLLEQFNIENLIDNPATVFDDIIPRQDGSDSTATQGGAQPLRQVGDDLDAGVLGNTNPNNTRFG